MKKVLENYLGLFFSDKAKSSEKNTLVEEDKTYTKDAKNVGNLSAFFLNTVKNWKIPALC